MSPRARRWDGDRDERRRGVPSLVVAGDSGVVATSLGVPVARVLALWVRSRLQRSLGH